MTEILDEGAVAEIESQLADCTTVMFPITANRLRALCATVKHLRAQVDKFSTLADERHDLLSAERRENDQLRQQRARLSGRVEQLRQCVVDIGKENADLQSQLEQLRAENERLRELVRHMQFPRGG